MRRASNISKRDVLALIAVTGTIFLLAQFISLGRAAALPATCITFYIVATEEPDSTLTLKSWIIFAGLFAAQISVFLLVPMPRKIGPGLTVAPFFFLDYFSVRFIFRRLKSNKK